MCNPTVWYHIRANTEARVRGPARANSTVALCKCYQTLPPLIRDSRFNSACPFYPFSPHRATNLSPSSNSSLISIPLLGRGDIALSGFLVSPVAVGDNLSAIGARLSQTSINGGFLCHWVSCYIPHWESPLLQHIRHCAAIGARLSL